MRRRIFEIIEIAKDNDKLSQIYDLFMIILIIISIIPLAIKEPSNPWQVIDNACVTVFIVDYILRLATADYKFNSHSITSFIRYPFSPMAIVDLNCPV